MIFDAISVLLVIVAAMNNVSTVILIRAALRHHWASLEERATVAFILALIADGAALLGLNRLHIVTLPNDIAIGILAVGLLCVSAPSLIWLWGYWTGRFNE